MLYQTFCQIFTENITPINFILEMVNPRKIRNNVVSVASHEFDVCKSMRLSYLVIYCQ